MSPRYDVPNAAPEPLRQVQLFLNSIDVHNSVEWLPDWLRPDRDRVRVSAPPEPDPELVDAR